MPKSEKNQKKTTITYADAGVDVDKGNSFVNEITSLTKTTIQPGATVELGGFGGFFDLGKLNYKDPLLVSTTDGVGTKVMLAQQTKNHRTIGIDLVAMCVNDLVVHGAQPLFFLDYLATGKLFKKQAKELIEGITQGCKKSDCALIGGETAEMPGMYLPEVYDLAGFSVGIVERSDVLPKKNQIQSGDLVIGLQSSGLHANGFSLIRKLLDTYTIPLDDKPPFSSKHESLGNALLEPTKIYVKSLLPLMKKGYIKAAAHITGGGLIDNIPRILPDHTTVELDTTTWKKPELFNWIAKLAQLDNQEMMRTFNCGIGMVLIISEKHLDNVRSRLEKAGEKTHGIGKIISSKEKKPKVIIDKNRG